MKFLARFLTVIYVVSSRLCDGQDCDSFNCLRVFHNAILGARNDTSVCSIAETYHYCVNQSVDVCTSLALADQLLAAERIKLTSLCYDPSVAQTAMVTPIAICVLALHKLVEILN